MNSNLPSNNTGNFCTGYQNQRNNFPYINYNMNNMYGIAHGGFYQNTMGFQTFNTPTNNNYMYMNKFGMFPNNGFPSF